MNDNNYKLLKARAIKRKYEIVSMLGGKCQICGYNKNLAALEFHHINPQEKEFELDARKLANSNLEDLKSELQKCILVCSNCHKELHHSNYNMEVVRLEITRTDKLSFSNYNPQEPRKCQNCGRDISHLPRYRKYCSLQCINLAKLALKNLPTLLDLYCKYEELKSWNKVAEYFGITRKITQVIRKRGV